MTTTTTNIAGEFQYVLCFERLRLRSGGQKMSRERREEEDEEEGGRARGSVESVKN